MSQLCPVCREGTLSFNCYVDSDGDGAWATNYLVCELVDQECDCELTDDQVVALETAEAQEKL
jgi:hypothetical protein